MGICFLFYFITVLFYFFRTIFEHEGATQTLAFTPDSQYLVTACTLEFMRVWYVQDLIDTTSDLPCIPVAKVDNAHDLGVFCADISKQIKFVGKIFSLTPKKL